MVATDSLTSRATFTNRFQGYRETLMSEWTREKLDALADAEADQWVAEDRKAIRAALLHFTWAILREQENVLDPPECEHDHLAILLESGCEFNHCPFCGQLLEGSR